MKDSYGVFCADAAKLMPIQYYYTCLELLEQQLTAWGRAGLVGLPDCTLLIALTSPRPCPAFIAFFVLTVYKYNQLYGTNLTIFKSSIVTVMAAGTRHRILMVYFLLFQLLQSTTTQSQGIHSSRYYKEPS